MFFKLLTKRKFEREYTNQQADYLLYNCDGKILNKGKCFIDNISEDGLGLCVNSPFFKEDYIQINFIYKGKFYSCTGIVTRDISWSKKTGLQINKIEFVDLN
jgi:hypothetical protein